MRIVPNDINSGFAGVDELFTLPEASIEITNWNEMQCNS